MRLLSTKTLEVVSISEDEIPPYAILSHTWDTDEVTLQDMQGFAVKVRSTARRVKLLRAKKGLQKVLEAAKLAASEGHDWIWIDTCCIDKTSSAELSEAINSMYKWYESSIICYVYLSDATSEVQGLSKPSDNTMIRNSRWVTRGWTLQELIAPRMVSFYSKDWSFIGNKNDEYMMRLLEEATGIDTGVLSGDVATHEVSVANRMRWASERETRRQEDMAYCLMGLFGVNMPLLYGEGGARSFIRLQSEILQATDDQTIFAWSAPTGEGDYRQATGLLAESPAYFFGVPSMYPMSGWNQSEVSIPWSMTNRGLMVQLFLRPSQSDISAKEDSADDFLAVLDCSADVQKQEEYGRASNYGYSPAISLRRLWGDQYARVHADCGPDYVNMHDRRGGQVKTLFVKQDQSFSLPSFTVAERYLGDTGSFVVSEVYPRDLWDSKSGMFRAGLSRQQSVQGLFRFSYLNGSDVSDGVFDVAVALQSTASGQFEPIGFLRPLDGRTVRQAYHHINKIWVSASRVGKAELAEEYRDKMIAHLHLRGTQRLGGLSHVLELVHRAELEDTAFCPVVNGAASTSLSRLRTDEEKLRFLFKPICVSENSQPARLIALDKRIRVRSRNELLLQGNSTLPASMDFFPYDPIGFRLPFEVTPGTQDTALHYVAMYSTRKEFDRIMTHNFDHTGRGRSFSMKFQWRYLFRLQNGNGETVLHRAAAMSNFEVVSYICEHAPSVACQLDSMSRSTLWHAACGGDFRIISVIAAALKSFPSAPSVDYWDDNGLTPLHVACREGYLSCAKVLLDLGASPLCATQFGGLTPIHYASLFGHHDCLKAMANHPSASMDFVRAVSNTNGEELIQPIHLAAANGWLQCVQVLIDHGSPLTPLASFSCMARASPLQSTLQSISKTGSDAMEETEVQVQKVQRLTPEEIAAIRGWDEVFRYLRTARRISKGGSHQEQHFDHDISISSPESSVSDLARSVSDLSLD